MQLAWLFCGHAFCLTSCSCDQPEGGAAEHYGTFPSYQHTRSTWEFYAVVAGYVPSVWSKFALSKAFISNDPQLVTALRARLQPKLQVPLISDLLMRMTAAWTSCVAYCSCVWYCWHPKF